MPAASAASRIVWPGVKGTGIVVDGECRRRPCAHASAPRCASASSRPVISRAGSSAASRSIAGIEIAADQPPLVSGPELVQRVAHRVAGGLAEPAMAGAPHEARPAASVR